MAGLWRDVWERFWSPDIWLPKGVTWDDFESPSPDIYYPKVKDINWSLAVGVFLLTVRYIYERCVVVPIARALGVKDRKRHVPPNPVLENAFTQNKGKITHDDLEVLAKKTELTVREIERWILKRRKKDAPSPMTKFREVSWLFLFYSCSFVYGLYILWHRNWFWEIKYTVIGWPKLHVDRAVYMFYLVELGFYWSLLISSFTDVKRSDFIEMVIHHILTITLIYLSWTLNYVRYGAIVLVLHDAADNWLAAVKMAVYSEYEKLSDVLFVGFITVWIVTRLGLYPFWVVKFIIFDTDKYSDAPGFTHVVFVSLLCGLQILHIIWTFFIFKAVIHKFNQGTVTDVRSDSENCDDDETEDTPTEVSKPSNGASHTNE